MLLMLKVATLTKSLSGAEQRYTPRDVNCVFIEMCLEPYLKIGLPV
jgi:hypothetical protein